MLVGVLVCLTLIAPAADAQTSRKKEYPLLVSRQPLTQALESLSQQTGVFYGYIPETQEEELILVGPLQGSYTIDAALTELLSKTGLTFIWSNSKSIAIKRAPAPPPQAEPAPPKPREVQRELRAATHELPEGGKLLDTVITTASRIKSVAESAAATVVIDRKAIERSGGTTVSDVLRVISQQPFLRPDGFRSNGAHYAELRGLGPDTTQVLISGLRALPSAASFNANAFDLNQIPLSAVEQIEVKLDSISARHGADAIGGVINIVLRDDIAHPGVELHYGTADGGGTQRQAAVSAGYRSESLRAAVILDYRDVAALVGAERELWNNQDYSRFGSRDLRSTLSSPGNVMALPGSVLPGLGAPFAAIPEPTSAPTTLATAFRAGELNRTSLFRYVEIVPDDRRASAVATAQLTLTPGLLAAGELLWVDRSVTFQSTPPLVPAALVPATNPYNPFGLPVLVSAALDSIDSTQVRVDSRLIRSSASLRARAAAWDWELSVLRSEEDADSRIDNVLDLSRLALVLANPDPLRTVNLFTPGGAASADVFASVLAAPDLDTYAVDGTQLVGVASGSLFALPAGDVAAVLGAEWRKEGVQFDSLLGSFEREVTGAFAELHIPVLGGALRVPAAQELTLTGAARFDRYTDFGSVFSPQYGLVWKPLRTVKVRATHTRSFRPPSIYDLYLPPVPLPMQVADPRRNREVTTIAVLGGGNPGLEATRGSASSAGIELTPEAIEPLKLSATYWRVRMDDRVTALPSEFILAHEADIADRVLRAAPTPADLAAGLPGKLLQLDVTRMNFGRLTTSGVDIGASYTFDAGNAGRFTTDVQATWIDEYEALDLPAQAAVDRVDVASSLGTIARWRAIARLDWERGALGSTAYVRYIPSYDDTRGGVRNGRTIGSQAFLDLQLSLDLEQLLHDRELLRGLELTAGASNLLNQQPHFAEVNGIQGYDTSQGDLEGRFWYLRLGKTF
ncbi:MAG TPA: TonB-dependent receptor [Steroidobacteraceae bacterium]|nr:TonB-dependent receptor [Steroidobacteraceae bacterium]